MKKNIQLIVFLLLSIFIVFSFSEIRSQSSRMKEKFYIGFFNSPYYPHMYGVGYPHPNYYKLLSANSMQAYGIAGDHDPTNYDGGFFDALSLYSSNVNSMLSSMNSNLNNNSALLSRTKIQRPAYGQRSTYEAEYESTELLNGTIRPGYGYINTADSLYTEGNVSGRFCKAGLHQAGYMVYSLYENLEQVNNVSATNYIFSDRKSNYPGYRWYVKPRMKIDSAFANNSNNFEKNIVKIETYNFDGDLIDTVTIKVRFFLDINQHYNGGYMEMYNFPPTVNYRLSVTAEDLTAGATADASGRTENLMNSQVDYRIHWYGEVDVWLDYVRVDDEWAHFLFTDSTDSDPANDWQFYSKLDEEITAFGNHDGFGYFYIDEYYYNNLPCIAEVNRIIKQRNSNTGLISVFCPECTKEGLRNPLHDESLLNDVIDKNVATDIVMTDRYFLKDWYYPLPPNLTLPDPSRFIGTADYRKTQTSNQYNDTLNYGLRRDSILSYYRKTISYCKQKDLVFSLAIQLHTTEHNIKNDSDVIVLREPTNEEVSLQCYLGLTYGASHIFHFIYPSDKVDTNARGDSLHNWGMLKENASNPIVDRRIYNYYGQDKWDGLSKLDSSLSKIGKYIYDENGLVHDDNRTVDLDGLPFKYVKDLKSIYRDPQSPYNYTSTNLDQTKYWEFGFFNPDVSIDPLDKSKYFMAVNKRCTPEDVYANGDLRTLRIKFDSSQLSGFNNWKIIEAKTNTVIRTFDKDSNIYVDMGIFQPGEGKLYKLAPVMQEGGTLFADEDCGGFEFECRGEVNNNGHDITIVPNTTILFANSSARIIMNGGKFQSGIFPEESLPIMFKSIGTATWKGMKLNGCTNVEIYSTHFEDVSPYPVDSTYAVEITDCGYVNISNSGFIAEPSANTGALLISYTSDTSGSRIEGVYLYNNNFNMHLNAMPAVSVIATGYVVFPMLMEWNSFESNSVNSSVAILLSNVTGGAIKENNFSRYDRTVFMLGSSIDFYGNYIIGSNQSSVGIVQHSASNANLSASGEMFTGGYNVITVEGQTAKCIQLANSYLQIDEGCNSFKLEDSATVNYHLEGTIPNDFGADPYPAEDNCFEIGYAQQVKHNLRWIDETPINLDAVPTNCNTERPENLIVFNLENNINDTIRYESGGSGGGERAIRNYELGIKNYENSISENLKESVSNAEAVSVKALSDSVSINLRKRDYERVSILCSEMLTEYADSINDASIISKLYLAELKQDTISSRMSELKSFLESYSLNNPEKEMMVRQAFYFIQKCKVSLGLYESAMTGFQQIINQFPYSYEGLLASWDYAATSLLYSNTGSGAGQERIDLLEPNSNRENDFVDDPNDKYDSRKFSTEDRKMLSNNLSKTFTSIADKQSREIKSLEEKVTKNEATNSEKKKYQEMRTLKEVVKARKPETIALHVSMISDDLSRIMKSTGGEVSDKYEANILPNEFALHQNYPNPFNPATKISFDLPQDSKVNLIVYDLLGREVIRLVNNEFKVAGKYTYDFNGASLSSGVYFCRLVVSSSNPLETVSKTITKRMMLIK
jgi:hypothetical protein